MPENGSLIKKIRENDSKAVVSRRRIAAIAAVGLVDFSVISLFQMGYIKHLPDLPGKIFDSDSVNSSKDAELLGMPDAPLSLVGYATTIAVAAAGNTEGKYTKYLDLLLGGIVVGQAYGAGHYLYRMVTVQKKVCMYCVAGALLNFAALKPLYDLYRSKR